MLGFKPSLVAEATALPTVPQPLSRKLPSSYDFFLTFRRNSYRETFSVIFSLSLKKESAEFYSSGH